MICTEQERDALMETVELYGDLRERFGENPECEKLLTAIRAMLAPDDAVLRTEVAAVIATRIIHPNAVYMNGPFRSRSEQDRCEWAADEIIAVLRGEATRHERT